MALPFPFDFKNPDYLRVYAWRQERLVKIRENPELLPFLKRHYRDNPVEFINDWGCTSDPRKIGKGQPVVIPFLLFPKQEEAVQWILARWKGQEHGVIGKSREMGVSWLTVALAVTLAVFNDGANIGFCSRKREYVDKRGDPKSLFEKARQFLSLLPVEFRGGWELKKHCAYMRIRIPETGSTLTGDSGDFVGRGDRTTLTIVDEAAFFPRPELVEGALSQSTDCRIDVSTPHGSSNPFAKKFLGKNMPALRMHWRDDPRKDQAWYDKQCRQIDNPALIAQELDLDFDSSVEGRVIPSAWIQASIDAHLRLKVKPTGQRLIGFDVADEGNDKNAIAGRHGILLEMIDVWSGKNGDIFSSVQKVMGVCDELRYELVEYDADGLGVGVRGDARVINAERKNEIKFKAFRGSGAVVNPTKDPFTNQRETAGSGRTNEDYFRNRKAQAYWALRNRFRETYRAVVEGLTFNPDEIISLSGKIPNLDKLTSELCQPTYEANSVGKMIVNKAPSGAASPNLADAVMIAFAPKRTIRSVWDDDIIY